MTDFIFLELKKFADANNLEFVILTEKRPSKTAIARFIDKNNGKRCNIAFNLYDLLNVTEKEILKETIDEVTLKLLNKHK